MAIRFARSARRHGIARGRVAYVIEHCGLRFDRGPPAEGPYQATRRVFLGDDSTGAPLEVMAVELQGGDLLVIHAMPLRARFRPLYEEAAKWRR